ncbi:MAG: alpha/beta hydrolase [Paracoccaceae bacterium]
MGMQFFTTVDGARLAYRDEGQGLAVLCLAGLTRNGDDFNFLAPHLSHLRLIRPDYRGRGASDWTGAASYSILQEAADVLALLDHLGLERVAIIGTSRGGLIGTFLAATARDRIAGLCLNDIGPTIEGAGMEAIAAYVGRKPVGTNLREVAARLPAAMEGFDNVTPERWLAFAHCLYSEGPQGVELRYDPELRAAVLEAMQTPPPDLWPFFDAVAGLPLALIRAVNSNILSAETAAELHRRHPAMITATVPDRGHVPFLDEPEALGAIKTWLEEIQ